MRIIAVASGKGGVGKTTLTANLGVALATTGLKVVLFDADLGLANLDVALGLKSERNIQHVVDGFSTMSEVAVDGPAGIRVVTGGSGVATMIRLSRKRLEDVLSRIADMESGTDVLIFDVSSGVDAKVMTFLKLADEAILVTNPDPSSVVDAYTTAKVLFRYKKDAQVGLVVNRVTDENQALIAFETVKSAAHKFLRKPVNYLGFVREDLRAARISRSRKPFVTEDIPASRDIKKIAKTLASAWHKQSVAADIDQLRKAS